MFKFVAMSHLQLEPILGYNSGMESPVDIAKEMERCLELGACCPDVIGLISDDARRLIAGLKTAENVEGLTGLRDDVNKVLLFPFLRVGSQSLDKVEKADREAHDKVLGCVDGIRFLANRVLQIKNLSKPASNPVYELWIHKMTRKGSLGAKFLCAMGEKPAKTLFSAKELEEAIGIEDNGSNSTRNTLYEISAKSRGTDFELVVHREGDGSVRFFVSPNLGEKMGRKKVEAEIFVKKVAPREGTHERRMARFLVKNFGKWLTAEDIALEFEIKGERDIRRMIIGPLNRIAERCSETSFRLKKRFCCNGVSRREYMLIKSS